MAAEKAMTITSTATREAASKTYLGAKIAHTMRWRLCSTTLTVVRRHLISKRATRPYVTCDRNVRELWRANEGSDGSNMIAACASTALSR